MSVNYINEVKECNLINNGNTIELKTNLDSVKILFEFLSDDIINISFYQMKNLQVKKILYGTQ